MSSNDKSKNAKISRLQTEADDLSLCCLFVQLSEYQVDNDKGNDGDVEPVCPFAIHLV